MIEPGLYNYWIVVILMMAGFYIVMSHGNLVKKIVGLNVFQTSVFILYISFGQVSGATAPILDEAHTEYGIGLKPLAELDAAHAVVLAVPHGAFLHGGWALISKLLIDGCGVVADVKGALPRGRVPAGMTLWRL